MTEIEIPPEGKAAVTQRLTREGRWGIASARKDEIALELREGGLKRSEANAEAWKKMAQEYPPMPVVAKQKANQNDVTSASQAETIDERVLTALPDSTIDTFELDTWWVLNHMACVEPNFSSAPSKGAVALFFASKRSPDRFISNVVDVVRKAIKERKPTVSSHQGSDPEGDDALIEEIESLLGMDGQ